MSEDVVGQGSSNNSSGGVWEQSTGLRWQLVGEQEERIPSRSRSSSRRDGPVDPGLSIQVTIELVVVGKVWLSMLRLNCRGSLTASQRRSRWCRRAAASSTTVTGTCWPGTCLRKNNSAQ